MLSLKLLKSKKFFTKPNGDKVNDLISSTFSFSNLINSLDGIVVVQKGEDMRADLVCHRIYGNHNILDALLKYNGISNPFSIKEGDILFAPPYNELYKSIGNAKEIKDIGENKINQLESTFLDPKTNKDKKRLEQLKNKIKNVLPPNVNKPGDKNIKIKEGKLIFGEDVTSVNLQNCPTTISRARLQQSLLKNKLFI